MNVVECRNLTKVYGQSNALNNISFTIEEKTITGLVGRNGAGKTTLMKIIAGFLRETSGDINVFSQKPFNNLSVSANTIFIDDQMNLPRSLQLKEILEIAGRFYENWDEQLAQSLFDYFSLNPNQYHNNLSKGMKSTFNMILGLSSRCALTIFDEPTTGMDAAVRKDCYRALLKDYIAHPRAILLSSHHLDEVENLLEDVLLMKNGQKELHIPVSELKEWAIGIKGEKTVIDRWIYDQDLIHKEIINQDNKYVVVKNNFTEPDMQKMKIAGLTLSTVSASDVCVYLTSKQKGGIDDVFNRSQSD